MRDGPGVWSDSPPRHRFAIRQAGHVDHKTDRHGFCREYDGSHHVAEPLDDRRRLFGAFVRDQSVQDRKVRSGEWYTASLC